MSGRVRLRPGTVDTESAVRTWGAARGAVDGAPAAGPTVQVVVRRDPVRLAAPGRVLAPGRGSRSRRPRSAKRRPRVCDRGRHEEGQGDPGGSSSSSLTATLVDRKPWDPLAELRIRQGRSPPAGSPVGSSGCRCRDDPDARHDPCQSRSSTSGEPHADDAVAEAKHLLLGNTSPR